MRQNEKVVWDQYHNITIWGKRCNELANTLKKRDRVFIEGSIQTHSYLDKSGKRVYYTDINATLVQIMDSSGEVVVEETEVKETEVEETEVKGTEVDDDEVKDNPPF